MDRNTLIKWLLTAGLLAGSLALVTPPSEKIRLGLDLKGGTSFVVKIDDEGVRRDILAQRPEATEEEVTAAAAEALKGAQERALEVLRNRIDNLGIAEPVIYPSSDNRITIQLPGVDEKKRKEAEDSIHRVAFLEFRMVHENNDALTSALFEKGLVPEGYRIEQVGGQSVYVEDKAFPDSQRDEVWKAKVGRFHTPDANYELLVEKQQREGRTAYLPRFVKRRHELSGEYLKNAKVDYQQMGQPVVLLEFDAKGAKMFYRVTSAYAPGGSSNTDPNRSRQLAIVLDGTLYSAPAIREAIAGGKAEISGSFTVPEATLLSNILRAGSLPAPVKVIERRVVDPTLGADSIKSGISAGLYGCGAIVVLMAGYYLLPGLLASLALLLNVLLLPIGMIAVAGILDVFSGGGGAASGIALPVLTLPGIAGIALSIGMAVDANVLIFERIREELRAGKTFGGAIQAGYQRAFTAIFDSNVTTIITAAILFVLGSGPVRGYAVTLAAGLLVSMFTAVVVTRLCFDAIGKKSTDLKLLRMMQLFSESKIDFMKWWKPALTVSLVIIIGAWAVMTTRGMQNVRKVFGVDFTGGSAVSMGFEQRVEVDAMRAALSEAGVNDAMIQYQGVKGGGDEGLQLKVGSAEDGALAAKTLAEKFPQAGFKVLQEDDVGPQVGGELKRKAMWAMLWSLVAMVIYISWRFEFGFALGAVVALFHDVLITAGIIHLMGFQISLTVVAALMTIVGYSVNDTIVIFDRIREDLRLIRNKSFLDICNLSMNQTLSRTILTNFLTFVSVLCLVAFGGSTLRDFSVTMFIGMIAGTYSTMYIATPVVLLWYRFKTPDLGSKSAG